jgi:hypothetical protein
MRPVRRNIFWRPLWRRLCAAVTLCAYVLTTLGFPLPAAAHKAETGAASCCQQVCGCPAEQRERHECCCSHPAPHPEPRQPASPKKSCCEIPAAPEDEPGCDSPCCQKHAPEIAPNPQTEPDEEEPEDAPAPDPAPAKGPHWVLGVAALQCQGQSTLWVSSGAALPPAAPLSWAPGLDRVGWLRLSAVAAFLLSPDPPAPPPRLSQV